MISKSWVAFIIVRFLAISLSVKTMGGIFVMHFCYDDEIRHKVSKEVATKTINQGKHK